MIRAIVVGLVVALTGTLSWSYLVVANTRYAPSVPWAAFAMALLLVAWWHYWVNGRGWPSSTSLARQRAGRANAVPDHLWGPALGAGVLGLFATLLLQGVLARLVTLPQQGDQGLREHPVFTVFVWLVMSAIVAGVVEETAYRGYMQGGIEPRYGMAAAIITTGITFGLGHFTHPEVGVVLLPYYLAVATVYGLLAAATNSTFPNMVLHAGGNLLSAVGFLLQGRSEWALTASPPLTVWEGGIDASFIANVMGLLVVGGAAALAYRSLFRIARST